MSETDGKNAFDRVITARHPERPYTLDLLESIFTDFAEVRGDRRFADDPAIVCGFARLDDKEVAVIGHQKGRDTSQRRHRNFAMPKPEGYRKALRLMKLAEKFNRPIITFIDTPGAYPGIDAEERGQAEAIAFNLREMASLRVPIIAVVLGEGGSGGALAIGIGDKILMMENAVYSVISPEGCSAILWKDAGKADLAAAALKLTASDLQTFGLIDAVIPETQSWEVASDDSEESKEKFDVISDGVKSAILKALADVESLDPSRRVLARFQKFRDMGRWA